VVGLETLSFRFLLLALRPIRRRYRGKQTNTFAPAAHRARDRSQGRPAAIVTIDTLEQRDDADLVPAHLFLWALG